MSEPNPFSADVNPYAATNLDATANPISMDGAEGVRRKHLNHEASVKSIGTLYIIGCVFTGFAAIIGIASVLSGGGAAGAYELGFSAFLLLLALTQGYVGYNIRKLKPWSRVGGIVFSALGLIAIPVGTLISAYFLYLLLSAKGKTVFSEEYQHVIAQTPHVKYKTSIIVWIFLGLLVLLLILGVGSALFTV